ncbi:Glycosyltransferase [Melia azedarach]|uniref:Glycosyltransferase n=1 Tax=Melia azedarach TaxID=155640 RepID=A0ACC1X361_MELAZ|nr:Glycosyltransferase [Melia azedarach]
MDKAELVFIPSPGAGHLVSTVELAKLLVERDHRLSITLLIMKFPSDSKTATCTESLASNLSERIKFINLPDDVGESDPKNIFKSIIENKKPHVREVVNDLKTRSRIAGFVVDMFCTSMIEVADEFGVPSYIFFTSSAASLGLMFRFQALHDEENVLTAEIKHDSNTEFKIPTLANPIPARYLPSALFNTEWVILLHEQTRKFRQTKGIIVNSFLELQSHAINSLSDGKTPPIFPVGPVLSIKGENYDLGPGGAQKKAEIMTWLDDQPESSVVFLCFGSMGSFGEDQVKEIARGLEQSGHRFLWSLRRPPPKGKFEMPSEYEDLTDILPEGFLDRTSGIGKVIGWAPQVAVLGHRSIGGFVSHCGWNSTLESLWSGVPIATWPMYAEQQFNAFEMVRELGLAVEIKMDYRKDFSTENPTVVSAGEIERGIRGVMEQDSGIRKRVKEISEKARKALMDGGSSFSTIGRLIDDVLDNIS